MFKLVLISILVSFGVYSLETPLESAILDQAEQCSRVNPSSWGGGQPERSYLRSILRIETDHGVPNEIKGLLLAMACAESGYNPNAEGDHKFDKHGRPKAIGAFQQWPWMKHDRTDPYASATAQMRHWVRQLEKTDKFCGSQDEGTRWAIAQVRSVRRPGRHCLIKKMKAAGHKGTSQELYRQRQLLPKRDRASCRRCYERSQHWKRFKRWRKEWKHLLP
jgi:hypothetical protein